LSSRHNLSADQIKSVTFSTCIHCQKTPERSRLSIRGSFPGKGNYFQIWERHFHPTNEQYFSKFRGKSLTKLTRTELAYNVPAASRRRAFQLHFRRAKIEKIPNHLSGEGSARLRETATLGAAHFLFIAKCKPQIAVVFHLLFS
jgi:hypothetical protein